MYAYDVEKLVRRASQTMDDTLDLWWYFTAFGLMYAFLSDDKKSPYAIPTGFDGVPASEIGKLGTKVVALGLDLERGAVAAEACKEAFAERRDYYDGLAGARKLPKQGTEALFAIGFNAYRVGGGLATTSDDGRVSVEIKTKEA